MRPPTPTLRVLFVDDNPAQLRMLRAALGGTFEVLEATDGIAAYAIACAEHPAAVVVLDISMPVVDGWTVVRKLRANPRTRDMPVVLFTGMEPDDVPQETATLNVYAVLCKSLPARDLEAVIRRAVAGQPDTAAAPVPTR
jgi:CheY-like chemotaxis protein